MMIAKEVVVVIEMIDVEEGLFKAKKRLVAKKEE